MTPRDPSPYEKTVTVLNAVKEAWYAGRPIVPILGAGFSVDSGYPILNSICRYLARLKVALDNNLLIPTIEELGTSSPIAPKLKLHCETLMKTAREQPIRYIAKFGWPDRFELAQAVARHLSAEQIEANDTYHSHIEKTIINTFSWLAEKSINPRATNAWAEFVRDYPMEIKQLGWIQWSVQGDWRRLIQFFTDHQEDYADSLFARFGFQRSPGLGHRAMSLLVKLLSIRTIFTFNFDDFIERSLTQEGLAHRIFGMEHRRTLPSPNVTDEGLSVIKMHGSHHSILIDERLDRPLKRKYINRFYDLTGNHPLLLVLGCSVGDRRLEDLLASDLHGHDKEVCWVHFEGQSPVEQRIKNCAKTKFLDCPTNNPGAFVRHLLYHLGSRFPASSHFYPTHPHTPTVFGKSNEAKIAHQTTIQSSEDMLKIGTALVNRGFVLNWVDLESVHTLAGVVSAIIDGCRRVDPELPPSVMPLGDFDESSDEALSRLEFALQRQRYAVLIDGVNTFGSCPLMHHSSPDQKTAEKLASELGQFLEKLCSNESDNRSSPGKPIKLGQSIIVVSQAGHQNRREDPDLGEKDTEILHNPPGCDVLQSPFLWCCLATLRRTRSLPTIRRLVAPLVGHTDDESRVDELLYKAAQQGAPIQILEGGDVWFNRAERDRYYEFATRWTGKAAFLLLKSNTGIHVKNATSRAQINAHAQAYLMAFLHRKIASTYFSFEFLQSRDASSFLEYTYHRISSIRYISRSVYLAKNYPETWNEAFGKLSQLVSPKGIRHKFSSDLYFGNYWNELACSSSRVHDLRQLRIKELESLLASWKEYEQWIRSQIPAEQLLHWIDRILSPDNMKRLRGVCVGPDDEYDCHDETDKKCDEVQAYFHRLLVRIHLERGNAEQANTVLKEIKSARSTSLQLDQVECKIRGKEPHDARIILENLEERELKGEDLHRYRHMKSLLCLGGSSWLDAGLRDGVLNLPEVDPPEAIKWAEKGLNGIRGAGALLAPSLEGMIVSSGSPDGAYRSYRSVFRTLKGRAIAAELLRTDLQQRHPNDIAIFRRAMRQFDEAKGGLETQHALLTGWADLHAAEATLLFVHRMFDREDRRLIGAVDAKLMSCRTHLLAGINALKAGRRNALWWRHCYQLIAQYHTERLFADFQKMFPALSAANSFPPSSVGLAVDILRRYNKALRAIAAFADYSINRSESFNNPWLKRTFIQLHLSIARAITQFESGRKHLPERNKILEHLLNSTEQNHPRAFHSTFRKITMDAHHDISDLEVSNGFSSLRSAIVSASIRNGNSKGLTASGTESEGGSYRGRGRASRSAPR